MYYFTMHDIEALLLQHCPTPLVPRRHRIDDDSRAHYAALIRGPAEGNRRAFVHPFSRPGRNLVKGTHVGFAEKFVCDLAAEDEALLRMMTAEMAEELGHRVVAEAGTIQAAEPLARSAEFDPGLLDINVGGTDIAPFAEIIAARGLPFILVSGYGPTGRPVSFQSTLVLQKPFLISDLAAMIDKALEDKLASTV